jgi:hypothetical protein
MWIKHVLTPHYNPPAPGVGSSVIGTDRTYRSNQLQYSLYHPPRTDLDPLNFAL